MGRIDEGSLDIAAYLLSIGRGLSRAGRLAGMIQVCRPHWSTDAAWYAAQRLTESGVEAYGGSGSLTEHLAYLDAELCAFSREYFTEQSPHVVDEMQLHRWAERWQRYRRMAGMAGQQRSSIAA